MVGNIAPIHSMTGAYWPVALSVTSCLEGEYALDRLWEDHLLCRGGARRVPRSAALSSAAGSASGSASGSAGGSGGSSATPGAASMLNGADSMASGGGSGIGIVPVPGGANDMQAKAQMPQVVHASQQAYGNGGHAGGGKKRPRPNEQNGGDGGMASAQDAAAAAAAAQMEPGLMVGGAQPAAKKVRGCRLLWSSIGLF